MRKLPSSRPMRGSRMRALVGSAVLLGCWCGSAPASAQTLSGAAATDLDLQTFAKGIAKPTDIAILPDGRGVITLQGGDVVVYTGGAKPTAGHITTNTNNGEQGLLGGVADTKFAAKHYLYFYADDA